MRPLTSLMTDEHIIAYLLQELTEEEAEHFEEQCFAQEKWPAELDSVEQDLIDAYLRNELSKDRHQRFEEKYLITDTRKARVLTAKSFIHILCPQPKPTLTLKEKIEALWHRPFVPQTAVAILIIAILVPVIALLIPTNPKTYTRIDLAMASPERGAGPQMEKVKLPLSTDGLEIHLNLPPASDAATYRVEWEDAKGKSSELKINSQDNQAMVVLIPGNRLSPGKYVLNLFKNGQRIGSYFFIAEETAAPR
jgi:hypothetical protein